MDFLKKKFKAKKPGSTLKKRFSCQFKKKKTFAYYSFGPLFLFCSSLISHLSSLIISNLHVCQEMEKELPGWDQILVFSPHFSFFWGFGTKID